MASVLNTNMASITAQRYLTTAQNKLQTSYEKLSSGSRINRAQDDAAGMGISQKLVASINSTSMAIRNANDAIGAAQRPLKNVVPSRAAVVSPAARPRAGHRTEARVRRTGQLCRYPRLVHHQQRLQPPGR